MAAIMGVFQILGMLSRLADCFTAGDRGNVIAVLINFLNVGAAPIFYQERADRRHAEEDS